MAEHRLTEPTVSVVASSSASRRKFTDCLAHAGLEVTSSAAQVKDVLGDGSDVVVLQVPARGDAVPRAKGSPVVCVLSCPAWKEARTLLREGASAVVAEDELQIALPAAVRSAYVGQLTLPSRLRMQIAQPVLSVREKQMLAMVVMGFTNPEIARKLHVAESTVKSHLSSAFAKLGVRSRNEATALILDPATGLGTGILEISGTSRAHAEPAPAEMVPASAA